MVTVTQPEAKQETEDEDGAATSTTSSSSSSEEENKRMEDTSKSAKDRAALLAKKGKRPSNPYKKKTDDEGKKPAAVETKKDSDDDDSKVSDYTTKPEDEDVSDEDTPRPPTPEVPEEYGTDEEESVGSKPEWHEDARHCRHCNCDPCVWTAGRMAYLDALYSGFIWRRPGIPFGASVDDVPNKTYRYASYGYWSDRLNDTGRRMRIPTCVVRQIRARYPEPSGQYVGFIPTSRAVAASTRSNPPGRTRYCIMPNRGRPVYNDNRRPR